MTFILRSFLFALTITSIGFLTGCSEDDPVSKAGTFATATQDIGNGNAKAWVKLDDAGAPVSMGITLSDDALQNLPQDTSAANMHLNSRTFTLPTEGSATGLVHATMDWNPKGHEPDFLYGKPHFDFHFYLISESARHAITGGPDAVPIPANEMPADYYTPPPAFSIPMMGVHYVDSTDLNNSPGNFEHTFIYGFLAGDMIFLEPMITKAFLESKGNFSGNIKLPLTYKRTGLYYPTKYSITYDATTKEHTVALEGFVLR